MSAHARRHAPQQQDGADGRRDHQRRRHHEGGRQRQPRQQRVRRRDESGIRKDREPAIATEDFALLGKLPHRIVERGPVAGVGDPAGGIEHDEVAPDRHIATGIEHAVAVREKLDLERERQREQRAERNGQHAQRREAAACDLAP